MSKTDTESRPSHNVRPTYDQLQYAAELAQEPYDDVYQQIYDAIYDQHEKEGLVFDASTQAEVPGLLQLWELGERRAAHARRAGSIEHIQLSDDESNFLKYMQIFADFKSAALTFDVEKFDVDRKHDPDSVMISVAKSEAAGTSNMTPKEKIQYRKATPLIQEKIYRTEEEDTIYLNMMKNIFDPLHEIGDILLYKKPVPTDLRVELSNMANTAQAETKVMQRLAELYPVTTQPAEVTSPEAAPPDSQSTIEQTAARAVIEVYNRQTLDALKAASRGNLLVSTDTPQVKGEKEFIIDGEPTTQFRGGFQSFGDVSHGYDGRTNTYAEGYNSPLKEVEALFVKSIVEPVYEERPIIVYGGFLKRQKIHSTESVRVGSKPVEVLNAATNQMEPVTELAYQFYIRDNKPIDGREIRYTTLGGRPGNYLTVSVRVPQSVASAFVAALQQTPQLARQFAQELTVSDRTGITEDEWRTGVMHGEYKVKVEPPYDQLPRDWSISIINLTNHTKTKTKF